MGAVHGARSAATTAAVLGVLAALMLPVGACGGDDAALRTFGAEGAHALTLAIELHDGWIGGEGRGGPGAPPEFTIPSHTDLTLRVTNAGAAAHALTLYASDEAHDVLAATPPIPPGGEATMQFHFHGPMRAWLRDDGQPFDMTARITATP